MLQSEVTHHNFFKEALLTLTQTKKITVIPHYSIYDISEKLFLRKFKENILREQKTKATTLFGVQDGDFISQKISFKLKSNLTLPHNYQTEPSERDGKWWFLRASKSEDDNDYVLEIRKLNFTTSKEPMNLPYRKTLPMFFFIGDGFPRFRTGLLLGRNQSRSLWFRHRGYFSTKKSERFLCNSNNQCNDRNFGHTQFLPILLLSRHLRATQWKYQMNRLKLNSKTYLRSLKTSQPPSLPNKNKEMK